MYQCTTGTPEVDSICLKIGSDFPMFQIFHSYYSASRSYKFFQTYRTISFIFSGRLQEHPLYIGPLADNSMPCEGVEIYRLKNKVSQIFSSLAGERNRFCWQHCILEIVPKPIVMNEVFGVIRWILNLKSLINANNSVQRHVKCVFFKILSHKLLTFYI